MIDVCGRDDVVVQWFSDEYIRGKKGKSKFDNIVVDPDEVVILIKDGKIEDMYTQTRLHGFAEGFWERVRAKFSGSKNIQVLFVSLRQTEVRLPIHGYTSDRTEIKGEINVIFRVSKDNVIRLCNLYKRHLKADDALPREDYGKVKMVSVEDIQEFLQYDTNLAVDASVLSKTASSEIRGDLEKFNARVRNAVDSLTPVWVNCGLAVDVGKVDISENAYEDAMRRCDEISKAQLVRQAEYAAKAGDAELKANLDVLFVRKDAELRLAEAARVHDVQSYVLSRDLADDLVRIEHECEVRRVRLESDLEGAKASAQIDRVHSESEQELRKRKADTDAYVDRLRIATEDIAKDGDVRRQIDLMNAKRGIEIEKAYEDGKKNGKELADKEAYNRGYSDGRADALMKIIDTGGTFNGSHRPAPKDERGDWDELRVDWSSGRGGGGRRSGGVDVPQEPQGGGHRRPHHDRGAHHREDGHNTEVSECRQTVRASSTTGSSTRSRTSWTR